MVGLNVMKKRVLILGLLLFFGVPSEADAITTKNLAKSKIPTSTLETTLLTENKVKVGTINYDEILEKAQAHSYDLKIADFNVLIAKQEVRGARSEYFPKLNAIAANEYTKNFRDIRESTVMSIGESFINPYTRYQAMLGITLNYNLFDFGVRKGNLDIAKEDIFIKELETQQKRQDLTLSLIENYSKILVTQKQININKEILALELKNLDYKTRLFNAKEISKTDLNDAKVRVNKVNKDIAELKSIKSEALSWLSFYTGEDYDADNLKIADLKKTDFDILKYNDYTNSVTWQIYEKQLKKKELELKVAKKAYLPKVNAYSRYYWYGSDHDSYGKSFDEIQPSNYSIGGSVYMPLFDGFKTSANIQKTALELKQLQVERDKSIAQLMTKVGIMRSNLMYIDEQIAINKQAISELTDKEKSVRKLVSKKVLTPIDANESKIELLEQQLELEKNEVTEVALTKGIQILTE